MSQKKYYCTVSQKIEKTMKRWRNI